MAKSASGWKGDPERHSLCGKKGGARLVALRGPDYMRQLGSRGGAATFAKHGSEHMAAIARGREVAQEVDA